MPGESFSIPAEQESVQTDWPTQVHKTPEHSSVLSSWNHSAFSHHVSLKSILKSPKHPHVVAQVNSLLQILRQNCHIFDFPMRTRVPPIKFPAIRNNIWQRAKLTELLAKHFAPHSRYVFCPKPSKTPICVQNYFGILQSLLSSHRTTEVSLRISDQLLGSEAKQTKQSTRRMLAPTDSRCVVSTRSLYDKWEGVCCLCGELTRCFKAICIPKQLSSDDLKQSSWDSTVFSGPKTILHIELIGTDLYSSLHLGCFCGQFNLFLLQVKEMFYIWEEEMFSVAQITQPPSSLLF